jgi:hypothetical protein
MADLFWIQSGTAKAVVEGAEERDRFTLLHGWSEATEPADGDFVWMAHPDDDIAKPGLVAWAARAYWQGIGWQPAAPPEPVNPAVDPVLTDARDTEPPDGTVDVVKSWVGGDPVRAEAALKAERARETPRVSLVGALEQQMSAAPPAHENKE